MEGKKKCTVDSSWGHLGQFEAALLQEGDGDLHAVVRRTLQQKCEHLQAQNLVGLNDERAAGVLIKLIIINSLLTRLWAATSDGSTYHILVDEMSHKL